MHKRRETNHTICLSMNFYETLKTQLQKIPELINEEGNIKKWVVVHKAQNFDEKLISLLLNNQILKKEFFINIKGILVFNQYHFIQFLEYKNYFNDSYTQYKNKVGLTIAGKHLKQRNEVALVWPYKDCVLEGGQSREKDKKEEIFFNETLAQDEITQLLAPKVLTNAKVFDKDGEHSFTSFRRDAEVNRKRGLPKDTITDNLIVKGNNLLALHSIKKEFVGKVKLIYIDPPYNTGNDGFKYNDNFNHSTWLTFMKNRLEVARELLRDDGVIFVQCDDNEQAYLKVLMDEVFGRNNLNSIISVKVSSESGVKVNANKPVRVKEMILIYSKTQNFIYKKQFIADCKYSQNYSYFIKKRYEDPNDWEIISVKEAFKQSFGKNGDDEDLYNFQLKCKDQVFSVRDISQSNKEEFGNNPNQFIVKEKSDKTTILWKRGEVVFFSNRVNLIDGKELATKYLSDMWTDIKWDGIANEGGIVMKFAKKPEKLLQRIIEMSTKPNDLVLDFNLGSGTTSAVAHKMGRQYIGIEQMDYIEDIAVERMKKVIEGEQRGISKSVNWQGGGSFTYFELKKYNQNFMEQIEVAKDTKTLLKVWEEMKKRSFLNYNLDIKKQESNMKGFMELSFKKQKQHLCELLDKNQMYINLSSLKDEDLSCTNEEEQVTEDFYQCIFINF